MSTVDKMIAALETYPGDAEVWLDFDPHSGSNTVHIHPRTAELECHEFWDGINPPVRYQPTITVYEDWMEEL